MDWVISWLSCLCLGERMRERRTSMLEWTPCDLLLASWLQENSNFLLCGKCIIRCRTATPINNKPISLHLSLLALFLRNQVQHLRSSSMQHAMGWSSTCSARLMSMGRGLIRFTNSSNTISREALAGVITNYMYSTQCMVLFCTFLCVLNVHVRHSTTAVPYNTHTHTYLYMCMQGTHMQSIIGKCLNACAYLVLRAQNFDPFFSLVISTTEQCFLKAHFENDFQFLSF